MDAHQPASRRWPRLKTEVTTLVISAVGAIGSTILAAVGEIDPSTALINVALATPMGAVAAFSLLQNREMRREHARERSEMEERHEARMRETWRASEALRGEVAQTNQALARIETLLERR